MNKKYLVRLTEEERAQLSELVNKGQAAAYKIKHAKPNRVSRRATITSTSQHALWKPG
ncbi:hypothetical protein [Candidatus Thiosymbion oneisti]|uniref:hypothetical protein n=1 Tax=Candidatus Thiosymbion oneisti TaxID=589554 RepID=UPI001414EBBB|nr:hypothetical protein [Candidatus Thiosymbion oneisti]